MYRLRTMFWSSSVLVLRVPLLQGCLKKPSLGSNSSPFWTVRFKCRPLLEAYKYLISAVIMFKPNSSLLRPHGVLPTISMQESSSSFTRVYFQGLCQLFQIKYYCQNHIPGPQSIGNSFDSNLFCFITFSVSECVCQS